MGINCGEKKNTLYLRWRFVFEETKFKCIPGFLFLNALVWIIFFLIIEYFFTLQTTAMFWRKVEYVVVMLTKGVCILLFVGAVIDNIKQNRLIIKGKVIIAEIGDRKHTFYPWLFRSEQHRIKCSYFDYEKGKLWEYKGTYTNVFDNIGNSVSLANESYIPVLVDENDYSKYFVLTKELAQSYWWNHFYGVFQKPIYFTKPIREIDLTQVENGLRFSNDVRFQ